MKNNVVFGESLVGSYFFSLIPVLVQELLKIFVGGGAKRL